MGVPPEFEEFGPYYYRESDYIENVTYGYTMDVPGTNDTKDALRALLTVNATHYDDWNQSMGIAYNTPEDGDLDQPIYMVNQALQGAWYQANNSPFWRTAIAVIYSVVLDGIGRQLY